MRRFTELYLALDETTRTSEKHAALIRYFNGAPIEDVVWAVHFLTGHRFRRAVPYRRLRDWASEASGLPAWLVNECYDAVGDFSETVARILPTPTGRLELSLSELVREHIEPLARLDDASRRRSIEHVWSTLEAEERFVFHKLLSGGFRVGVQRRTVIRALSEWRGIDAAVLEHRLSGPWTPTVESLERVLDPTGDDDGHPARPYPFFLASPLEQDPGALGAIGDWVAEWKWDGIRVQLLRRAGEVLAWSRGEELITEAFPELREIGDALPDGTVLDGEVLAWEGERPLPFSDLQRRLNRKRVEAALFQDVPVVLVVYDLLEHAGEDWRARPLVERRASLESIIRTLDRTLPVRLSDVVPARDWAVLASDRETSRERGVEGIMLKRGASPYGVGRTRGDWWKWKIDPYTLDAVLIYAQPGSGRRASLFTDYTFGVWDGDELVPIAKAYSGLTNEEISKVDAYVRANTTGRHGPLRSVTPTLVFELAFEGINESTRHKSGIALRFPRMARWRTDKPASEADTIETVRALLASARGASS